MENQEKLTSVFSIFNNHVDVFPYKALSTHSGEKQYIGYFQNKHGEQWIFIYNDDFGGGILTGGDISWNIEPVGNADVPLVDPRMLSEDEYHWVLACWSACEYYRPKENRVPSNALLLPSLSYQWKIPYKTLLSDAESNRLEAKKMGNIWVTTLEAMKKTYGSPSNTQIEMSVLEENDKIHEQEVEFIRIKLLGE